MHVQFLAGIKFLMEKNKFENFSILYHCFSFAFTLKRRLCIIFLFFIFTQKLKVSSFTRITLLFLSILPLVVDGFTPVHYTKYKKFCPVKEETIIVGIFILKENGKCWTYLTTWEKCLLLTRWRKAIIWWSLSFIC